jgi:hypothetical protein
MGGIAVPVDLLPIFLIARDLARRCEIITARDSSFVKNSFGIDAQFFILKNNNK